MLNSFQSPGEVAFYIFDMPVYFYGIIMAIAVFVGFYIADYLYNKLQQINVATTSPLEGEGSGEGENNLILDISPYLIISGIIGARLYYCLVNYSYYIQKPLEIFFIRQGGLSIHGAIIAGTLTLFYFSKKYKVPFLSLTDVFLCGTILAQSIGRWGNFFNSEAFGYPCDLPWKLYIPISHRPLEYINFEYFHPTFLYESLLDLGIFVVLFIVIRELEEGRKIGRLEGRLVNKISLSEYTQEHNSDNSLPSYPPTFQPSDEINLSEILQKQQPDTNPSTLQPFNLSTENSLSSCTSALQPFGIITSLYLILYACARIFVEHFRIDSALNISGMPIAQIVSVAMLCFGVALLKFTKQDNRP